MKDNLTLCEELVGDLPNLEVFNNKGKVVIYRTEYVTNGELTFVNVDDDEDEWFVKIRYLVPECEMGTILNFDDYFSDLQESSVTQDVIDYRDEKRIAN